MTPAGLVSRHSAPVPTGTRSQGLRSWLPRHSVRASSPSRFRRLTAGGRGPGAGGRGRGRRGQACCCAGRTRRCPGATGRPVATAERHLEDGRAPGALCPGVRTGTGAAEFAGPGRPARVTSSRQLTPPSDQPLSLRVPGLRSTWRRGGPGLIMMHVYITLHEVGGTLINIQGAGPVCVLSTPVYDGSYSAF